MAKTKDPKLLKWLWNKITQQLNDGMAAYIKDF